MRKICIQSGHWNMTSGATGAPQEQVRTIAIGKRLVDLLRSVGAEVYHTDAFADSNTAVTKPDWDLFLALHCDANYAGNEGGGFVDWIDPSIDSSVASNKESQRVAEAIESVYFSESGIRDVPSRRNPNTKFYYMWNVLSANTHCVIIEMGESIDPHDNVILNDTEREAQILLKGIQKAYPDLQTVIPTPIPPVTNDCATKLLAITKELEDAKKQCALDVKTINDQKDSLSLQLIECQKMSTIYKAEYDKANEPTGYKVQIIELERQKKGFQEQITKDTTAYTKLKKTYDNLRKSGLKFMQDAIIRICDKLGVDLT